MMSKLNICIGIILCFFGSIRSSDAEIEKEKIYLADHMKNNAYIKDGLITGGDRSVEHVDIQNIRRSSNSGFERVVIDLRDSQEGVPTELKHLPYFQAALHANAGRLVFTIWGRPKLNFDTKKVLAGFRKSSAIQQVKLLPKLDDDSWTFYMDLKAGSLVELFELSDPVRIILDIKKKK